MTKQPFSNFDLPRQHLSEQGHYVPPAARDEDEIRRRRALPAGTLLAEQQAHGVALAGNILSRVEAGEDMLFTTQMLGMATINSSWYVFAQGKHAPDVMRRRLILPKLADQETDWRQTAEGLREETVEGLATAGLLAQAFAADRAANRVSVRRDRAFGRHLGNVSLHLAVLRDGQTTIGGNAHEVQIEVRDRALELLDVARQFSIDHHSHPSIAQLANPDSPLGVHWRNTAPNGAYQAYREAIASS